MLGLGGILESRLLSLLHPPILGQRPWGPACVNHGICSETAIIIGDVHYYVPAVISHCSNNTHSQCLHSSCLRNHPKGSAHVQLFPGNGLPSGCSCIWMCGCTQYDSMWQVIAAMAPRWHLTTVMMWPQSLLKRLPTFSGTKGQQSIPKVAIPHSIQEH